MKPLSIFSAQKCTSSLLCLGKIHQHPESNEAWKKRIEGITTDQSYRGYDGINGEPTEFEWNIYPGFTTLQLWEKHQKLSQEEFYLCRCLTTFLLIRKTMKKNVWHMLRSFLYLQRSLVLDNGHSLVQVLKRSGILQRIVHKEPGIILRTKSCWNSQKADVLLSVQRLHCPGVNSRSKGHGKLSIHFTADYSTIETIFRIIVSANQLCLYGAVANICEEFEIHQYGSGEPDVLMGQSIVLSEIKAEVPLQNDDPAYQNFLLQRYEERMNCFHKKAK